MLNKNDKGRILQIIKHCKRIEEKTNKISEEDFKKNIDIQEIVCFNLFQIGELVKGLSKELLTNYDYIPWKNIKGMRDRIGHGYGTVNLHIVWSTAKNDITELNKNCKDIIKQ